MSRLMTVVLVLNGWWRRRRRDCLKFNLSTFKSRFHQSHRLSSHCNHSLNHLLYSHYCTRSILTWADSIATWLRSIHSSVISTLSDHEVILPFLKFILTLQCCPTRRSHPPVLFPLLMPPCWFSSHSSVTISRHIELYQIQYRISTDIRLYSTVPNLIIYRALRKPDDGYQLIEFSLHTTSILMALLGEHRVGFWSSVLSKPGHMNLDRAWI